MRINLRNILFFGTFLIGMFLSQKSFSQGCGTLIDMKAIKSSICQTDSFKLKNQDTSTTTKYYIFWNYTSFKKLTKADLTLTGTFFRKSHKYNTSGSKRVRVIAENGTCFDSLFINVRVDAKPTSNGINTYFLSNSCAGSRIAFAAKRSTSTYDYYWNINGKNLNGDSLVYKPDTATSFTKGTTNVSYSLKIINATCTTSVSTRTVKQKLLPRPWLRDETAFNDFGIEFNNCGNSPDKSNPQFDLLVKNLTKNYDSLSIDFGNGNDTSLSSLDTVRHIYQSLGIFNLTVNAYRDGCSTQKSYQVINEGNPAVGLSTLGSTNGCSPQTYPFILEKYKLNSDSTYYIWDFGDGSPTITWRSPITNDTIWHTFEKVSCDEPNRQFIVSVTAVNSCDQTKATVDNIKIFKKPVADFCHSLK
jgi:hypothetical protein